MNSKLRCGYKIAEFDILSWNKTKTGHETGKDVLLKFFKFPAPLTLLYHSECCVFGQQEGKRLHLTRMAFSRGGDTLQFG